MAIHIRSNDNCTIVSIEGEVDLYSVAELRKEILKLIDDNISCLIIDMSKLNYMDSSGIALMANLKKKMKAKEKKFGLLHVSDDIMDVLKLAALEKFFNIYKDESEIETT